MNSALQGQKVSLLLKEGQELLKKAGIFEYAHDSRILLEWILGLSHMDLLMDPDRLVPREQAAAYNELVIRRSGHEPLQYLIGECEFMGFPFFVNEDVLIPRQDTEVLAEWVIERETEFYIERSAGQEAKPKIGVLPGQEESSGKKRNFQEKEYRILDLCTGSGCLAVSVSLLLQESFRARGCREGDVLFLADAADLSKKALDVAKKNAKRNHAAVCFKQSDMFSAFHGQYDVIMSNPPYIPSAAIDGLMEEVRCHEPRLALDGDFDGLHFYRVLAKEAGKYLKPGGRLYLEIGHDQEKKVAELLECGGFTEVACKKDLAGLSRAMAAVFP